MIAPSPGQPDQAPTGNADGTSDRSWVATTHVAYRDWALEALNDERQVYARSTVPGVHKLVFLPAGQAPAFRAAARAGELVCPVPGCPSPQLTTRGPRARRHHFVHLQTPSDPNHHRAYVRRVATELIAGWIHTVHPRSTVETDVTVGDLTITALVTGAKGNRFAIMFVDHRLGVDSWIEADLALDRAGMTRGWIFAPRPYLSYPRPAADAAPDDPAILDRTRGDILLDRALFREMRRQGHWPLLLNITTREVANLVTPTGRVAHRLGLSPPASADRVLHLLPSPLHDCRLCQDGIETPEINAHILAERRRTREQQKVTPPPRPQPIAVHVDQAATPNLVPERSRLVPTGNTSTLTRVERALGHGESTMTFQELMDRVGPSSDVQRNLLRAHLYTFRIERAIDFDGPLQPSTMIHRRTRPTE